MNIQIIREKLLEKGFSTKVEIYSQEAGKILNDNSIEVWEKENRVIALKAYINEFHFKSWVDTDKMHLISILKVLSSREKNNLYFIVSVENDSEIAHELLGEINRLEKDDKICKKYVLLSEVDIQRVPFLADSDIQSPQILDYEQQFKNKLQGIQGATKNAVEISIKYFE